MASFRMKTTIFVTHIIHLLDNNDLSDGIFALNSESEPEESNSSELVENFNGAIVVCVIDNSDFGNENGTELDTNINECYCCN